MLCTVDSNDRVFKESFSPISLNSVRGYFDVVAKRGRDTSGEKFTKALDSLSLGDEIAIKGGRYRLNYVGDDETISHITVVASGLGIAPALQILRGVLTGKESTVDNVELIWINEELSDFYCNDELEKLEYTHFERLVVTRILETDLFGRDISKFQDVRETIAPYNAGKIGIICAPDYVVTRARKLFYDFNYPVDNIISIASS